MFRYKKRRSRGNGPGNVRRILLFVFFFACFVEFSPGTLESFGAETIDSFTETEQPSFSPKDVSGSLAPLEEIELTAKEAAEAQRGRQRQFSRQSVPFSREILQWKQYASTYYYEKLSQAQKVFWDDMDSQCSSFLTGTGDAAGDNGSYWMPYLTYQNLTYEQAKQVYQMFRYSNPQYYFIGNSLRKNEENCIFQLGILSDFAKGTDRAAANARIKAQIEEMLSEINEETTPLRKEKMAHDLICEKVVYDENFDNMAKNKFNQTIYSVLCTDSTVCAGYSQTMMLLMNGAGIDCAMVTSSSHAWNMVLLEGNWYYVDLTWDDQPDNWIYTYFNRSRDMMHKLDSTSHTEETFWNTYLPDLTRDALVSRTAPPGIQMQNGKVILTSFGGEIYYTLSGDMPFRVKKAVRYTEAFAASPGTCIAAVTATEGHFESKVVKSKVCQVDFVVDGGAYGAPQVILSGERIAVPALPHREGYTFTGWHINPECTKEYAFASPVNSSLTLYGKWEKQKVPEEVLPQERTYRVSFDSCGGNALAAQSIREGEKVLAETPVRKGYSFKGWYTTKDYREPYNFSAGVTGDLVLYAKWKPNSYRITYKANGGFIGKKTVTSKKVSVTYDKKYGNQPEAKRKGYVFLGWYTKKTGGSRVENTQRVKVTGNKTYYARWTKVRPIKAKISSVKSKAPGKITVNIKKEKTASGYQIRYSSKPSMSGSKKMKTNSTEKTVTGLKKGKKYYLQVRMYQKESVSGKISYGAWSKTSQVTVKWK